METKSTHRADVVQLGAIEKHPNADTLGIVKIWNFTICVRLADWHEGDLAVYIQPDSVVPDTPQFDFLKDSKRIKVRRFRGVYSQGLLIPSPEGLKEGDDAAPIIGITRYDPPIRGISSFAEEANAPEGVYPIYDVESWHRYGHLFQENEEIVATEKVHGANGRFVFVNGQMHCGSRTRWVKEADNNMWWNALKNCPWLSTWLQAHEGLAVYGEVFGPVQDLRYGRSEPDIRVFDVYDHGRWLSYDEMQSMGQGMQFCPLIYRGPYSELKIKDLAEGKTELYENQIREGIVIRPTIERYEYEVGRLQLKIVSNAYLER